MMQIQIQHMLMFVCTFTIMSRIDRNRHYLLGGAVYSHFNKQAC